MATNLLSDVTAAGTMEAVDTAMGEATARAALLTTQGRLAAEETTPLANPLADAAAPLAADSALERTAAGIGATEESAAATNDDVGLTTDEIADAALATTAGEAMLPTAADGMGKTDEATALAKDNHGASGEDSIHKAERGVGWGVHGGGYRRHEWVGPVWRGASTAERGDGQRHRRYDAGASIDVRCSDGAQERQDNDTRGKVSDIVPNPREPSAKARKSYRIDDRNRCSSDPRRDKQGESSMGDFRVTFTDLMAMMAARRDGRDVFGEDLQ
ncbi:hypothetical protein DFH09DRAFT_1093390 [Mycena vulgaris]|nr:hypothetical protein DFH09DRAFT_1093390 [Mycena vulgaris]